MILNRFRMVGYVRCAGQGCLALYESSIAVRVVGPPFSVQQILVPAEEDIPPGWRREVKRLESSSGVLIREDVRVFCTVCRGPGT